MKRAGRAFWGALLLALGLMALGALQAAETAGRDDFLSTLLAQHTAVMLLVDPDSGRILDANRAAAAFYGYPLETLRKMRIEDLNVLDPEGVALERRRAQAELRNYFVFPHRLADGTVRTVEVYSSPVTLASGRQVLLSIVHDVSGRALSPEEQRRYQERLEQSVRAYVAGLEAARARERRYFSLALLAAVLVIVALAVSIVRRRRVENALAHREEQLSTLIDTMPDIVCFKDGEGRWQRANVHDLRLLGLEGVDYRGKTDAELLDEPGVHRDAFLAAQASDESAWRTGRMVRDEARLALPGMPDKVFDLVKVPLFHPDGRRKALVVVGRDISERKAADAEIERLAHFDPLTGLPNQRLFFQRLEAALAEAARQRLYGAVLFVDLDDFKTLNDARGHEIGDRVLQEAARRIRALLADKDTVARFSGDEFVIVLPGLSAFEPLAVDAARETAERIRQALAEPFPLGTENVPLGASIGITLFAPEADTPRPDARDLVKYADTAMHQAKAAGRNQVRFFEAAMQAHVEARFALEGDLRQALGRAQMRVFIQPQVDPDGRIMGGEVLLRWLHPERGMIQPATFIPMAEETGVILELGDWVLEAACRLLTDARLRGRALRLAVNVSPRQFHRPDFIGRVRQVLEMTGADPHALTLEITEGLVIDNLAQTVATMSELTRLGIHFSIDDFGTGYSSLAYLKRLPLHELKIDKSFIQDAPDNPGDAALVDVIVSVARHLRLKVVAEGVETAAQAAFLAARGDMLFQGYLFGRPMPAEDFLALLGE